MIPILYAQANLGVTDMFSREQATFNLRGRNVLVKRLHILQKRDSMEIL